MPFINKAHSFIVMFLFLGAGLLMMPVHAEETPAASLAPSHLYVATDEPALSVNEPIYFVVGGRGDTKARFQLSFKYRVLDEESSIVRKLSLLKGMHFAYTQTSLWNLSTDSAPFEDSSYRPSLFLDFDIGEEGFLNGFIRTGYEHESNGQANTTSRSIDIFYFWPAWSGQWLKRSWVFAPKLYVYLSKDANNENIDEYRGNVDLMLRYGSEDSWLASATLRRGENSRSMVQLDLSYPIRKKIFARTGGFVYLQTFYGYGESLLTYDQKQDTQVRLGFAIVR